MDDHPITPDHVNQKKFVVAITLIIVGLIIAAAGTLIYHHFNHKKVVSTGSNVPIEASITTTGFNPQTIQITKGQSVVWTNFDSKPHDVASGPYPIDNALAGFKSTNLSNSQTYSFVFDQTGTFHYQDDLNPNSYTGIIIVK